MLLIGLVVFQVYLENRKLIRHNPLNESINCNENATSHSQSLYTLSYLHLLQIILLLVLSVNRHTISLLIVSVSLRYIDVVRRYRYDRTHLRTADLGKYPTIIIWLTPKYMLILTALKWFSWLNSV